MMMMIKLIINSLSELSIFKMPYRYISDKGGNYPRTVILRSVILRRHDATIKDN